MCDVSRNMSTQSQITYLFDPLCGWCYGAMPKLAGLARAPNLALKFSPTGLFSGAGARSMDAKFAAYAWANDQRIAGLTGQTFSLAYHEEVLGAHGAIFDSGPATLALTAVAIEAPEREYQALQSIQVSRYVDGCDVTSLAVLADIVTGLGLPDVSSRIASPDTELREMTNARIAAARHDMQAFGIRGVPALIVGSGSRRRLHDSAVLFDSNTDVVAQICPA
jgi:putative protein-disulfide isomerase